MDAPKGMDPVSRIAIIGSRDFPEVDWNQIYAYVNSLLPEDIVVSGGAKGPDLVAEEAALRRRLKTEIWHPQWSVYGRRAGLVRNLQIADRCDEVRAFWTGKSRGTLHTMRQAHLRQKPVFIWFPGALSWVTFSWTSVADMPRSGEAVFTDEDPGD